MKHIKLFEKNNVSLSEIKEYLNSNTKILVESDDYMTLDSYFEERCDKIINEIYDQVGENKKYLNRHDILESIVDSFNTELKISVIHVFHGTKDTEHFFMCEGLTGELYKKVYRGLDELCDSDYGVRIDGIKDWLDSMDLASWL